MHLPIRYIIDYTPISYKNCSFESSIRHISSYNDLLTEIEDKSIALSNLLDTLRVTVSEQLTADYKQVLADYDHYYNMLMECTTKEVGDYARDMMQQINAHIEHFENLIRDSVDQDLLATCNDKYMDIVCLKDDKYNEHDKWYYD